MPDVIQPCSAWDSEWTAGNAVRPSRARASSSRSRRCGPFWRARDGRSEGEATDSGWPPNSLPRQPGRLLFQIGFPRMHWNKCRTSWTASWTLRKRCGGDNGRSPMSPVRRSEQEGRRRKTTSERDSARKGNFPPARPRRPRSRLRKEVVGVRGFEPPTPASRTQYSTRLSYTPTMQRAARSSRPPLPYCDAPHSSQRSRPIAKSVKSSKESLNADGGNRCAAAAARSDSSRARLRT